jgi:hypothetical protein
MALSLTPSLEVGRMATLLHVAGIPAAATTVTIERTSPSGNKTGVRGAVGAPITTPPTLDVRDYEIPLDTTVNYTATAYQGTSVVGTATASFRIDYGECEAWLTDLARPTNSEQLVIESLAALDYPVPSGVYRVLDRRAPVVVALPAQTPSAELIVLTNTLDERDRARYLFGSGYPFLLRTTPEQGIGNMYLVPSEFVEERFLTLGASPERRFRVACIQVERPDPAVYVPVPPNTYAQVLAQFANYAAMLAAGTYEDVAYTYPTGVANPIPGWPPSDI